jgi:hypothetical protein
VLFWTEIGRISDRVGPEMGNFNSQSFFRATATWFSISSCLGGKDPSFFDMFFHFLGEQNAKKTIFSE